MGKKIQDILKTKGAAALGGRRHSFILLPQYWTAVENEDYEKELVSDEDDPIVALTPMYSEKTHEAELEEQSRFEAIRNWNPGDARQTVYATNQGN